MKSPKSDPVAPCELADSVDALPLLEHGKKVVKTSWIFEAWAQTFSSSVD
jgi:hypothetical protein